MVVMGVWVDTKKRKCYRFDTSRTVWVGCYHTHFRFADNRRFTQSAADLRNEPGCPASPIVEVPFTPGRCQELNHSATDARGQNETHRSRTPSGSVAPGRGGPRHPTPCPQTDKLGFCHQSRNAFHSRLFTGRLGRRRRHRHGEYAGGLAGGAEAEVSSGQSFRGAGGCRAAASTGGLRDGGPDGSEAFSGSRFRALRLLWPAWHLLRACLSRRFSVPCRAARRKVRGL